MPANLADLAARFDCELRGDTDLIVDTVGTLASAGANAVTFLANLHYRGQLADTKAGVVVLEAKHADACPAAALITSDPYATYARIADFLHPPDALQPGIHPSAIVAADAVVPASAQIGAHAVIGAASELGESVVIGPGCVIGATVRIGARTKLGARVMVLDRVEIGERCVLHPGCVVGSDGFGFAKDGGSWLQIPQLGTVVVGNDVSIGANTTIDRGTIENTVIEDGVILDNLIQIGHNVRVGAHTAMAALCGISGSTDIGERCMIAGAVVMVGHLSVCDDVMVTFHSTVTRSVTTPGTYSGGLPSDEASRWRKNVARFRNLDELVRRQITLEKRLNEILEALQGKPDDT
jgi:UDP-3-O-[3-hydroxymyristoyl] glucosamine N-acyltransferase